MFCAMFACAFAGVLLDMWGFVLLVRTARSSTGTLDVKLLKCVPAGMLLGITLSVLCIEAYYSLGIAYIISVYPGK